MPAIQWRLLDPVAQAAGEPAIISECRRVCTSRSTRA
jgi:hypothetical protein